MQYNFHIACYPFTRWPFRYQLMAYSLLLLLCCLAGFSFLSHQRSTTNAMRVQLHEATQSLSRFRQKLNHSLQEMATAGDLAAPSASDLSSLASEISKRADEQGIRISELTISLPNSGQAGLRPATLTTQLQGTYTSLKIWLGQNLQMYPWMAVDQMQWRLSEMGSGMLDVQVSWVVYVEN